MTAPALGIERVSVRFGGLIAVDGVTLSIPTGGRHGILGPNGAGKTTLFNAMTGFAPITEGTVSLVGEDITSASAAIRARKGLGRTFQITNLMPTLSTFENVLLGSLSSLDERRSWWRSYHAAEASTSRTRKILDDVGLSEVAETPVSDLSYGDKRKVELALALGAEPSVLLLDEPTAGLSVAERNSMVELLSAMPASLTTVIIEHDMEVMFALADRITVLHRGAVVMTGSTEEVKADPRVKEIYLGSE